jgi:hypothetical protein
LPANGVSFWYEIPSIGLRKEWLSARLAIFCAFAGSML